jgi:hypothetical protein
MAIRQPTWLVILGWFDRAAAGEVVVRILRALFEKTVIDDYEHPYRNIRS